MSAAGAVGPSADTIPALLHDRVAKSPTAVAYFYQSAQGWQPIDWQTFYDRARCLASALHRLGLQPGDHVGILAPTSLAWELFHHAILIAGGVVVGLEPHDIPERLQWIADHAELRMLVAADTSLLGKLGTERPASYRSVILLEGSPAAGSAPNCVRWPDIETGAQAGPTRVSSEAPATLIYTSGTTGRPKGILYRHDQAVLAVQAIADAYPSLPAGARLVCWLPLANLFQRIMNLAAMRIGGSVYLVSDPLKVLAALPQAQPDVFIGVPRFYEKLHAGIQREIESKPLWMRKLIGGAIRVGDARAAAQRRGRRVSPGLWAAHRIADALVLRKLRNVMGGRVRFMITGSAPTPVRLLEFFHSIGLPLFEAYGLSENIVPVALNRPDDFRFGTVGRPLTPNHVRIDGNGEVHVKGAGVFGGYYKDPDGDRFTSDGYYNTGDYASFDDDGFLRLRGRNSEIIKTSAGRRIAPLGIEAKLEELGWIERAIVVGAGRKCLAAILVMAPEARESAHADHASPVGMTDQLNAFRAQLIQCAVALPAHERPAGYLLTPRQLTIEAGDLTPNLKLRRTSIEARHAQQLDALFDRIDSHPTELAMIVARDDSFQ